MKIAFLSFYSGRIDRGVEVATSALAKELSKAHLVTLFQAGERIVPEVQTLRTAINVNWQRANMSNSWLRKIYLDYWSRKIAWFTLRCLPNLFRNKYDVIIPTNGGWQVVLIRIVTWIMGKKMVIQGNAGIGFDDFFQLHCFPNYYIAISPAGFRWAKQFAPWTKKTYIPYGVDVSLFKKAQAFTTSLQKPIVLCVAAFIAYKQIELLIKAMEFVPQASLLIIGNGPLEQKLVALGKKILGTRFQLITNVNRNQLIGYHKSAVVFSLPSHRSEGLGIVYIEAMAAGLPVVAPDDHNRREIIGDAGVFVNPVNSEEYAKGLQLALIKNFEDKPLRQAEKCAWGKIVKQYEEILKAIV